MEARLRRRTLTSAEYTPPGDKSISHRALILSAMSHGENIITGLPASVDVLATKRCLQNLGVKMQDTKGSLLVLGEGVSGFISPSQALDCENSGTTMRLLAGVLAGSSVQAILKGDASLTARPMRRVVLPLRTMGAQITSPTDGAYPPLSVSGRELRAGKWHMTVPSAQVKSAILLAALSATGESQVTYDLLTRDHTERMLAYFGAKIETTPGHITLSPGPLTPKPVIIPGDISSVAYFAVLAAVTPGARLVVRGTGLNPGRSEFLRVLSEMGAKITVHKTTEIPEPMGDIVVEGGELRGVVIDGETIPSMIDELPILAVAAAMAQGRTIVRGAQELRVKESDRITSLVGELSKMGVRAQELFDGFVIDGGYPLRAAAVSAHDDHRITMTLAIAACLCESGETVISGAEAAAISYPDFFADLLRLTEGDDYA
ncbi:MAG TPA: 3-phosphoshikimate 1-carboxyvinyltransferase [Bacillota bacterium]|nr:3-phosphoshikimate 1-carboxyvinyltransferase [Bacillota bacterium]